MVFTFDKSKGLAIGASLVEDDKMELVHFHSRTDCVHDAPSCGVHTEYRDLMAVFVALQPQQP